MFSLIGTKFYRGRFSIPITRSITKMSEHEVNNIFPKLNKSEVNCLLKIAKNEWKRWSYIIASNRSGQGNQAIAEDYEYDSIRFANLMDLLEEFSDGQEVSLCETYTAFLIEALDHEFDLMKENKSSLCLEELKILEKIKEIIITLALEKYGPNILKIAHYERGNTENE